MGIYSITYVYTYAAGLDRDSFSSKTSSWSKRPVVLYKTLCTTWNGEEVGPATACHGRFYEMQVTWLHMTAKACSKSADFEWLWPTASCSWSPTLSDHGPQLPVTGCRWIPSDCSSLQLISARLQVIVHHSYLQLISESKWQWPAGMVEPSALKRWKQCGDTPSPFPGSTDSLVYSSSSDIECTSRGSPKGKLIMLS